jgi:hypothetical protein
LDLEQGCQIFLGPNIPNWEKIYLNDHKQYQKTTNIPKGRKIFLMIIKYSNIFHSKIYQNWDFRFENKYLATLIWKRERGNCEEMESHC